MPGQLTRIITSADPAERDRPLEAFCRGASLGELLAECDELDRRFRRRRGGNLYERVRALFFLYAIHRFQVPDKLPPAASSARGGHVPYPGYRHLLGRRFDEAVESFLSVQRAAGPGDAVSSALAAAY